MRYQNGRPIFILGVPRSGTTLLRMMLDSHPDVMCGPEAAWISGRGASLHPELRSLVRFMSDNDWGMVSGFKGIEEEDIVEAAATFVDTLFDKAAKAHGKTRWADKTPENVIAVPFLARMFPGALHIHLIRDGRDVALSTIRMRRRRIALDERLVRNSYGKALRRWVEWNDVCAEDLQEAGLRFMRLRYEDLVTDPETQMRELLSFVGLSWHPSVLEPHEQPHDVIDPQGEGMKSFHGRDGIDGMAVARWQNRLGWVRRRVTRRVAGDALARWGYKAT